MNESTIEVREEAAGLRAARLRLAVSHAAERLPAQGPLTAFVHHNPLHAFEHLGFEQAVAEAASVHGTEPYLDEDRYRAELRTGRIRDVDLISVVTDELGPAAAGERLAGVVSRQDLRLVLLRHPVPRLSGPALAWELAEKDALTALRKDLEPTMRAGILACEGSGRGASSAQGGARRREAHAAQALWQACRAAVGRAMERPAPSMAPRHRDLLLQATGEDTDEPVHALLIRFCAAYLDQGLAYWPMPDRDRGMYRAFLGLYSQRGGWVDSSFSGLGAAARDLLARGIDAEGCSIETADALGVHDDDWEGYVWGCLSALRGWAGMVHQAEIRPDRLPARAVPARLVEFLAIRLLLDRLAVTETAQRRLGCGPVLVELLEAVDRSGGGAPSDRGEADAWVLFQLAQLLGCGPDAIRRMSPAGTAELLREAEAASGIELRRLFHLAYERRFLVGALDAFATHRPAAAAIAPRFQAVFCIDEREESLRRHLEAAAPGCETYGMAGYFGIPMLYRGAMDAHARPLCPVSIRPTHLIEERAAGESVTDDARWRRMRRWVGGATHGLHVGSRTLVRGAMLTAVFGLLAVVPLVARVLFPLRTARFRASARQAGRPPSHTELRLFRENDPRKDGLVRGFTREEMAEIVGQALIEMGLTDGIREIVLVVGHGSSSLNNPHEAAHDCGACAGGRGGPNARAFAAMANDPSVRALLRRRGIAIPESTRFVGAYHNTCDDTISYFDAQDLSGAPGSVWATVCGAMADALARNAHERCRRFESADTAISPMDALRHVAVRSEDLAQPRPEYGHATNAICVVGRRLRTAGLFLDRRAFLVSYDPLSDTESGDMLTLVLRAVLPVCAGVNLEYYFSYVDPVGYGSGTKLPHNIAALLGVMDGHAGDLRTGLPWQMVEVHEPVRLILIVEAPLSRVSLAMEREPAVGRLVRNRWVYLAALDPDGSGVHIWREGEFVRYRPEESGIPSADTSLSWYAGKRGPLPWASLRPVAAAGEGAS